MYMETFYLHTNTNTVNIGNKRIKKREINLFQVVGANLIVVQSDCQSYNAE